MERERCAWCGSDPLYVKYHDEEWGVPVRDDQLMFEFLVLESFQAGLSWLTILRKRNNFRVAFDHFNYTKIAQYDEQKLENLMEDASIVRNQSKIKATINNAQRFMEIQEEFGDFCTYFWRFTNGKPIVNQWVRASQVPAKTDLSDIISKDMKARGFKFLGSTTLYAHMQACGMVNDHLVSCFRHKEVQSLY